MGMRNAIYCWLLSAKWFLLEYETRVMCAFIVKMPCGWTVHASGGIIPLPYPLLSHLLSPLSSLPRSTSSFPSTWHSSNFPLCNYSIVYSFPSSWMRWCYKGEFFQHQSFHVSVCCHFRGRNRLFLLRKIMGIRKCRIYKCFYWLKCYGEMRFYAAIDRILSLWRGKFSNRVLNIYGWKWNDSFLIGCILYIINSISESGNSFAIQSDLNLKEGFRVHESSRLNPPVKWIPSRCTDVLKSTFC